MLKSTSEGYKLRFMFHREWQQKTSPNQASKNINKKLREDGLVTSFQAEYWYERFDKDSTDIFSEDPSMYVCSSQVKENPSKLFDSLFLIVDKENLNNDTIGKDGRFFMLRKNCDALGESKTLVYDLFKSGKGQNPTTLNISFSTCTFIGDYLLCMCYERSRYILYAFKIDHENLSFKEAASCDIYHPHGFNAKILPDQLDSQKFAICNENRAMVGQIQQNEIILERYKHVEGNIYGRHLIGNKLQYFTGNILTTMKFCELNLETMESEETSASIDLKIDGLIVNFSYHPIVYCWSDTRFYAMFKIQDNLFQLLMFDSLALKWTDVKISLQRPISLFVDKNEVLTFQVGDQRNLNAFYRIALRTPETLMNLTWLFVVKESNIRKNDRYLNLVKGLRINL